MNLSQRALQTNGKLFFFKFRISFRINGWKPKKFQTNKEASLLIKLQCVIYQWIRLNELYKLMESFFQISISFPSYWPKNIQIAWIFIEVQCVRYKWIWLDKLYRLMDFFFFFISESFFFFLRHWTFIL